MTNPPAATRTDATPATETAIGEPPCLVDQYPVLAVLLAAPVIGVLVGLVVFLVP